MALQSSVIVAVGLMFAISGAYAYSQQLGAYYSGLGMDTLGAGGVNCLFLAFFDPTKMTAADCNFSDPNTPCGENCALRPADHALASRRSKRTPTVAPAPGGGGQGLAWVRRVSHAGLSSCFIQCSLLRFFSGIIIHQCCSTATCKQHGSRAGRDAINLRVIWRRE